jgi:autoinducer 2-degrading protein
MGQFAILVTIKLKSGNANAFRPLILENAAAAVRDEENCHQFQVLTDEVDPDTFYFFEVYTNAKALESHRKTPHYQKYDAASQNLIAERTIQRCMVEAVNT